MSMREDWTKDDVLRLLNAADAAATYLRTFASARPHKLAGMLDEALQAFEDNASGGLWNKELMASGSDSGLELRGTWWVPRIDAHAFPVLMQEVQFVGPIAALCGDSRNVAIQAGGNIGLWPKAMSKLFREVHTFEPDPLNYAALEKNLKGTGNAILCNQGLGMKASTASMDHMDPTNIGAHRLKAGNDVEVVTIDSLNLADVSLISLDVEGFEHFALLGAQETIERCSPLIVVELKGLGAHYGQPDQKTKALIESWGYKLIRNFHRDWVYRK